MKKACEVRVDDSACKVQQTPSVCGFTNIWGAFPPRVIGASPEFRFPTCALVGSTCVLFPSGLDVVQDTVYLSWGHNDSAAHFSCLPLHNVLRMCRALGRQ